jgi:hypothetical protein
MATLLPKKTNQIPVATDDDHYQAMADDPSIKDIPQGSSWSSMYNQMPSSGMPSVQQPMMANNTPILTAAAPTNAATGAEVLVANTNETWVNKKWRPAMGWMYFVVCIFDFVLFPILWAVVQFWETEAANDAFRQWQPLTLQGAGLFHMAMGAIIGITSYGRSKEKIEGKI